MAFTLQLLDGVAQPFRVVPIRVARAVTGFSDKDAPDLDDRGFKPPTTGFGLSTGPAVGVRRGQEIRVLVVRDRVEASERLVITTDDATVVDIVHPDPGEPLSNVTIPAVPPTPEIPATDLTPLIPATPGTPERVADCIVLRGTGPSTGTAETKIKIHHNFDVGPVIAEFAALCYPTLTIPVQAHTVSINGTGPAGVTLARVRSLFERVNRIYAQSGIQFNVVGALRNEVLAGFATAGFVTLPNFADSTNQELQTVLNSNARNNHLNAYFVPGYRDTTTAPATINGTLGIAFSTTAANNPLNAPAGAFPGCEAGITMFFGNAGASEAALKSVAHTTAHEIGHCLTLEHYNNNNTNPRNTVDDHIWGRRNLMHNFVSVSGFDIGYGPSNFGGRSAGELLMTKTRAGIFQSDQINRMRRAWRNRTFAPVRGGA